MTPGLLPSNTHDPASCPQRPRLSSSPVRPAGGACGLALLALLAWAPPSVVYAEAAPASAAQEGEYGLWETVVRIDRFVERSPKPSATDRRKQVECLRPEDFRASALLQRSPLTKDLAEKCWVSSKQEEAHRSQVKWGCKDGTTAEIATRSQGDNRLGFQLVVNSPVDGGLSIRGESIRIARTCDSPPPR